MWVARDKYGNLNLFPYEKPIRSTIIWKVDTRDSLLRDDDYIEIYSDLFPDLKWEDEPIEVELIKKKSNETGR